MCRRCERRFKALGLSSRTFAKTYGQIKALAFSFWRFKVIGLYDMPTNLGVEAHLYKIEQACTAKRYRRDKRVVLD
jgi:hypothetical protein